MNRTTVRSSEAFRKTHRFHRYTRAETVAVVRRIAALAADHAVPEHAATGETALGVEIVRHALCAGSKRIDDHDEP